MLSLEPINTLQQLLHGIIQLAEFFSEAHLKLRWLVQQLVDQGVQVSFRKGFVQAISCRVSELRQSGLAQKV